MAQSKELSKIKAALIKRLGELDDSIRCDASDLRSNSAKGDPADVAFDAVESEVASRLAEHGSREVNQILRAIERIDKGDYGICENHECSSKIPINRLKCLPYTTLCINCQRLVDAGTLKIIDRARKSDSVDFKSTRGNDDDDARSIQVAR